MRSYRLKAVQYSIIGLFILFIFLQLVSASSLRVETLLLKVSMSDQDSSIEKSLIFESVEGGTYSIELLGVPGVSIDKSSVSLRDGEKAKLQLSFSSKDLLPGVYVGSVFIAGGGESVSVPVVYEIESASPLFDGNVEIPVNYVEIPSGSKLVATVKLYDLVSGTSEERLGPSPVTIEYKVFSRDGTAIFSESESVVVNGEASLTKTVSFPASVEEGNYVFAVIIHYKDSVGVSSNFFKINASLSERAALLRSFDWNFIIIIGVIILFFFGILILFLYLIRDRDKLFMELKRYNEMESSHQSALLNRQKKLVLAKKGVSKQKVEDEVKKKVVYLRNKHQEREKEFSRLRQKGDEEMLRKKLIEWKKEGYNTLALESRLGVLNPMEMNKLMNEWKKEYNTEGYKKKK